MWTSFAQKSVQLLRKEVRGFVFLSTGGTAAHRAQRKAVPRARARTQCIFLILGRLGARSVQATLSYYLVPAVVPLTLLVRGLLVHEVVFLALHKRWRVEYGGHFLDYRRMAVPYRAKDGMFSTAHYERGVNRRQSHAKYTRIEFAKELLFQNDDSEIIGFPARTQPRGGLAKTRTKDLASRISSSRASCLAYAYRLKIVHHGPEKATGR